MKKFNLALVLAPFLVSSTQAQQVIQTKTFGPSIPQFSTIMTFESYAGDVSDIESIVISWEMDIYGGQLVIDNDAVDPATGSYEFGAKISLDSDNTDVTTVNSSFAPVFTSTEVVNSGTFSLDGNDSDGIGDYSSEGADGMAVSGESVSSSGGDTVFSGVYSQYVSGPGGSANRTFDIGIVTEQYLNVTSDGGTEYAITPVNASGIVTLVYNLKTETIPEPSSMAMLALGGLALLRRKR